VRRGTEDRPLGTIGIIWPWLPTTWHNQ
jgi:hypothetical protein